MFQINSQNISRLNLNFLPNYISLSSPTCNASDLLGLLGGNAVNICQHCREKKKAQEEKVIRFLLLAVRHEKRILPLKKRRDSGFLGFYPFPVPSLPHVPQIILIHQFH